MASFDLKLSPKLDRQREMECAVCLDRLCQPRILSCSHNFCGKCLETLVRNQRISCPTCRQETTFGPGGVGDLPRNISLIYIMKTLCERCFYDDREVLCDECALWLCSRCHDRCKQKHRSNNMLKNLTIHERQMSEQRTQLTETAASVMGQIDTSEKDMIKHIRLSAKRLRDEVQQELDKQLGALDKLTSTVAKLKREISQYLQYHSKIENTRDVEMKEIPAQWNQIIKQLSVRISSTTNNAIQFIPDTTEPPLGRVAVTKKPSTGQSLAPQLATMQPFADKFGQKVRQPAIDYKHAQFEYSAFGKPGLALHMETGKFFRPSHVVLSPVSKNIIVLDYHGIHIFNQHYEFVYQFELKQTNTWEQSSEHYIGCALGVTETGLIVVAQERHHRLEILTEAGEHVRFIGAQGWMRGQFVDPKGLFVHDNLIYVCDSLNYRIQVLELGGEFVRQFGSYQLFEECDHTFIHILYTPQAITVAPNGDVIVTAVAAKFEWSDQPSYKFFVFSANGQFKSSLDTHVTVRDIELYEPLGVTTDAAGHIIVSDAHTNNIHILTASGEHLRTRGSYGCALGQFDYPQGLVCTDDGRIIVADKKNNRMQVCTVKRS